MPTVLNRCTIRVLALLCSALVATQIFAQEPLPPDLRSYLFEYQVPRFALVIGNRTYDLSDCVDVVENAANDAKAVGDMLSEMGFDTVVRINIPYSEMIGELADLANKRVRAAANNLVRPLVVVYFSGHGFNIKGHGYIAARDVSFDQPDQKSLALDQALEALATQATVILLIDACRSNIREAPPNAIPCAPTDSPQSEAQAALQDGIATSSRPLVPLAQNSARAAHKYLLAYATRLGFAAEGMSRQAPSRSNSLQLSPYTAGLYQFLGKNGEEIRDELGQVKQAVFEWTNQQQDPLTEEAYLGHVHLRLTQEVTNPMKVAWLPLLERGDRDAISHYLDKFPEGPFAAAAARWLVDHKRPER
jgi:hypothetical protein